MHLHRWPSIDTPTLVIQILRLVPESDRTCAGEILAALQAGSRISDEDNLKHLAGELAGGIAFVGEAHRSQRIYIVPARGGMPDLAGFAPDSAGAAALESVLGLQGDVIRATRMMILSDYATAIPVVEALGLAESDLISCHIGGRAPELLALATPLVVVGITVALHRVRRRLLPAARAALDGQGGRHFASWSLHIWLASRDRQAQLSACHMQTGTITNARSGSKESISFLAKWSLTAPGEAQATPLVGGLAQSVAKYRANAVAL